MTNADMIRGMSDEELTAILMCPADTGMADIKFERCDVRTGLDRTCRQCLLAWLQSKI